MFDFEKLGVYQKGLQLHRLIFDLIKRNPFVDYHFKDQLKRATTSIVANLAEGAGRFGSADKKRFYIISRGSAFEVVALLTLVFDTYSISNTIHYELRNKIYEIVRMLTVMIKNKSNW